MNTTGRLRIREIVVVEGIHDKQAVERVIQADIWVLGGDRIARPLMQELRRAGKDRGVLILTDPDGPGERIRHRLEKVLPGCKHAFVTKSEASADNAVGVEHASDAAILAAVQKARPVMIQDASIVPVFTLSDLQTEGLANGPGAAARRQKVGAALGIGYGNAKAFLRKLNVLGVTRPQWNQALLQCEPGQEVPSNES